MHCLAGLDTVTSGSVLIGDTELSGLSDRELTLLRRSRVGFIFQSFNLLPALTAEQNIRLPLELAGRRPDRTGSSEVVDVLDLGDRLGHRPGELSGGQQQRVACARALVTRPEVIFADEPTGNLDSRSGAEVLAFLRHCVRELGQTVIMVTARPRWPRPTRTGWCSWPTGACDGELLAPAVAEILDALQGTGMLTVTLAGLRARWRRLLLSAARRRTRRRVHGRDPDLHRHGQRLLLQPVRGPGEERRCRRPACARRELPLSDLAAVRAVPGVAAAEGRLQGSLPLVGAGGRAYAGTAIDLAADPRFRFYTVVSGGGSVLLDQDTAALNHMRPGTAVTVVGHDGHTRRLVVTGIIDNGASGQVRPGRCWSCPPRCCGR